MIDDLKFTKIERRDVGGTWVCGEVDGHNFQALVFPEHADSEEYELAGSKISKLWIQHNGREVFNWDRGMDVEAKTPEAQNVVEFLCAGLSEHVYA